MNVRRVAIAGAGMAGTSVACALVACGFAGEIVLIDERAESDTARTWCWWDMPGIAFREQATVRFPAWRVITGDRDVTRGSARHPYLCLRGTDFYRAAGVRLQGHRVRHVTSDGVARIGETQDGVTLLCASGRSIEADIAIDARGAGRPAAGVLVQRFVGRFVRTRKPVFEPGVATLMDFRAGRERPVHFTYVLPFSADSALIEDTVFTAEPPDDGARRENVERYVQEYLHTSIARCDGEERGAIPLDAARPPRPTRRVAAVGGAGGAIRASSGYAFVRTQQHARALASAIQFHSPLPALPARMHHRMLDAALLSLLKTGLIRAPQFFCGLFDYSDPDALVRFLCDASVPADDARVLAALLPRIA